MRHGVAFVSEAAISVLLLLAAAAFFPLFSNEHSSASTVALCTDAAAMLVKSNAFQSQAALSEKVARLSELSGLCMEAKSGALSSGDCNKGATTVIAISFPAYSYGSVGGAVLSCSFPEGEP
jgi:hypothetical protein